MSAATSLTPARKRPSLLPAEAREKMRLESVVRSSLQGFKECGNALAMIGEKKLYRDEYGTFKEYLAERWGLGKTHGYQMIAAAGVVAGLPTDLPEPTSERQVRPLVSLAPETRAEVYREAVAEAGGGVPSHVQVEAAREKVAPAPLRSRVHPAPPPETVIPAGVVVEVEYPELSAVADNSEPEPPTREADPEAWLETLEERAKLSGPARDRFDAEVRLYLALSPVREAFVAARTVIKAHARQYGSHIGPYLSKHQGYLRIADPTDWRACVPCGGAGVNALLSCRCEDCRGEGYHVV